MSSTMPARSDTYHLHFTDMVILCLLCLCSLGYKDLSETVPREEKKPSQPCWVIWEQVSCPVPGGYYTGLAPPAPSAKQRGLEKSRLFIIADEVRCPVHPQALAIPVPTSANGFLAGASLCFSPVQGRPEWHRPKAPACELPATSDKGVDG